MPVVGIVVPVYNALPWLKTTAASIAQQTMQNWICVWVDDGSTDGSADLCDEIAATDPRFRVIHQPNAGVSEARNAGSAQARDCEFWTFMDQDDVWAPTFLERMVLAARADHTIGAHCVAETIDASGAVIGDFSAYMRARSRPGARRFESLDPDVPTDLASVLFVNRVYPPGVALVRSDVYRNAGPWNSRFSKVQDWEMLLRLLAHGPMTFVDDCLVGYRRHDGNGSNEIRRAHREGKTLQRAAFARLSSVIGRRRLKSWWRQWELLKLSEAREESAMLLRVARVVLHSWRWARGWPARFPVSGR